MTIKITGINELKKQLEHVAQAAQKIQGQHSILEILTDSFISKHTSFKSMQEMFEKSGFRTDTIESIEAIPDRDWDVFISKNTIFSSWSQMLSTATAEYVKSQLKI